MQRSETVNRTNSPAKAKQKQKLDNVASPIRVNAKTREKIDELLRCANKQKLGRKVKTDDLISFVCSALSWAYRPGKDLAFGVQVPQK